MSELCVNAFLEALQTQESLWVQVKDMTDAVAIAAIAQQAGFEVTANDLIRYQQSRLTELSDEQLTAIGGGSSRDFLIPMGVVIYWGAMMGCIATDAMVPTRNQRQGPLEQLGVPPAAVQSVVTGQLVNHFSVQQNQTK